MIPPRALGTGRRSPRGLGRAGAPLPRGPVPGPEPSPGRCELGGSGGPRERRETLRERAAAGPGPSPACGRSWAAPAERGSAERSGYLLAPAAGVPAALGWRPGDGACLFPAVEPPASFCPWPWAVDTCGAGGSRAPPGEGFGAV